MINWPPPPLGNSPEAVWCRQMLACLKKLELLDGPDHRKRPQATGGFFLENVARAAVLAAESSSGLIPRGTWTLNTAYQKFDLVCVAEPNDVTALPDAVAWWFWPLDDPPDTSDPANVPRVSQLGIVAGGAGGAVFGAQGWHFLDCTRIHVISGFDGTIHVKDANGNNMSIQIEDGQIRTVNGLTSGSLP